MRRLLSLALAACFTLAGWGQDVPPGETAAVPTALGLKIHVNELDPAALARVVYGYDREAVCANGTCSNGAACATNAACAGIGNGLCNYETCTSDFSPNCTPPNDICGVLVESLTPGAPVGQTIWGLACNPATPGGTNCQVGFPLPASTVSWDFSGLNLANYPGLIKTASTTTPINSSETPNWNQCGFNEPGSLLDRQDKNWPAPASTIHTLNSIERENNIKVCMNGSAATNGKICASSAECGGGVCTTTATIWLRAAVRYEGLGGGLGEGESRICHVGAGRTQVPLFRFPNLDAAGQYMQFGDPRWEHVAFNCENTILTPSLHTKSCSGFEGKQYSQVVNEGVVKLPSGHRFKSLVTRSSAEYCIFLGAGCFFGVDNVRTVLYLWEVPHLGTVVRLQSDKSAVNLKDFTHLAEIDVKYGLFPPLELTPDAVTDQTVDLSWDPGLITDQISGYRIYWDTESGGKCAIGLEDCTANHPGAGNCPAGETCCATPGDSCNSYAFDSINDPAQVTFNTQTSATISGLAPATTYYFTVTAMSSFTDPASLVTTVYESVLYPTRIPAVPVDLPLEVSATTSAGCVPSLPVCGLTADKVGSDIQLCWDPVGDPCIDGYRVLGATSPESPSNFSIVESDTGLVTCATFTPSGSYFVVVGRGSGGIGPWGE